MGSRDPVCAWCIYRSGDDCTHPDSPVSGRACGPVCRGDVKCEHGVIMSDADPQKIE